MVKSVSHPIYWADIGVLRWYGVWYRFIHVLLSIYGNIMSAYNIIMLECMSKINHSLIGVKICLYAN